MKKNKFYSLLLILLVLCGCSKDGMPKREVSAADKEELVKETKMDDKEQEKTQKKLDYQEINANVFEREDGALNLIGISKDDKGYLYLIMEEVGSFADDPTLAEFVLRTKEGETIYSFVKLAMDGIIRNGNDFVLIYKSSKKINSELSDIHNMTAKLFHLHIAESVYEKNIEIKSNRKNEITYERL